MKKVDPNYYKQLFGRDRLYEIIDETDDFSIPPVNKNLNFKKGNCFWDNDEFIEGDKNGYR